ncbi:MAG: GTPase ObgE [bacterium]
MAFIDEVTIYASSGKGGDGVVRWAHTKEKAHGGPSGGDGGKGGNVVLAGVRDYEALAHYRYEKKFNAENGGEGKSDLKHGANGKDVILRVPIGTLARVITTGDEYEVTKEDERIILFRGGFGGKGNARFKSSTNQNPFQQTKGREGKGGDVELTLKIIADAGFIGLPNAGKSSLLNALTNAKSKVGAYPFTTLEPNLGSFYDYIIADIPGLIEGASSGKGLGIKFLKHVERTGLLLHLVSANQDNPLAAYNEVRKEIELFGHGLLKKREIIILSKIDLVSPQECETKMQLLTRETGREVLAVSVLDQKSLKAFTDKLTKVLK